MPLLLVSFCIGAWVGTSNKRGDKNLFYEKKRSIKKTWKRNWCFKTLKQQRTRKYNLYIIWLRLWSSTLGHFCSINILCIYILYPTAADINSQLNQTIPDNLPFILRPFIHVVQVIYSATKACALCTPAALHFST